MVATGTSLKDKSAVPNATFVGATASAKLTLRAMQQLAGRNKLSSRTDHVSAFLTSAIEYSGLSTDLRLVSQQRLAIKRYDQLSESPVILNECLENGPVIALMAHFQPEATSYPEGGSLFNHIDLVASIRRNGYCEDIAYFEHPGIDHAVYDHGPTRVGLARSPQYYENLVSLGCRLISRQCTLRDAMEYRDDIVPVTLTGSIAVERALEGRTTIVGGHPWFAGLPGTINLEAIGRAFPVPVVSSSVSAAVNFLTDILDGTTIANQSGIGTTGIASEDEDLRNNMTAELELMFNFLQLQPVAAARTS